ncbi:MAG: T9SS type A sorting domain-containing protein [Ignavibacteria bacterium]|nr:T9SS type A sorting domain-containing protein [Ignavibacteria bacterium]
MTLSKTSSDSKALFNRNADIFTSSFPAGQSATAINIPGNKESGTKHKTLRAGQSSNTINMPVSSKHIFSTVIIALFLFSFTSAQVNFTWLNPKPMGYTIYGGASIPSTDTVYGAGTKGVIIQSTDFGNSWRLLYSNRQITLYSVSFPSSSVGYAAGSGGTILKTTNSGLNWEPTTSSPSSLDLTKVQFISETVGFVNVKLKGKIFKTTNGGNSWSLFAESSSGFVNDFVMTGENNGFYITQGKGFGRITNGIPGETSPFEDYQIPTVVDFFNASIGIVAGSGYAFRTTDGGSTWEKDNGSFDIIPSAVKYFTASKITAVTGGGGIYVSTDNGVSWQATPIPGTPTLNTVVFRDGTGGIVLGGKGVTVITTNGGSNWSRTDTQVPGDNVVLYGITTPDGTNFWAGGTNGMIIKSTDGGRNWSVTNRCSTLTLNDICFTTTQKGFAVTSTGLYTTTNGGTTWANKFTTASGSQKVAFATEQNGYFCGTQGVVRYTTDGGTNWSTPGTLPAGSYYGIGVIPGSSTAYICGVGKVIKTTNNGASWSDVSSGLTGKTFYAAAFTSNQVGVVVGKDSVIYKTTNGGTSWSQKTSNTGSTLYTVKFYDSEHGIAAGGSGDIILTADGGESWSRAEEISESTIRALTILNGTTAIFAGDKGTLLLSEDLPLPVELVEFTAVYTGGSVRINWKTATEKDNNGFEVQRIRPGMGGSGWWEKIGYVEGHGTSNSPKYYSFTDKPKGAGKYRYRLKQIDNDGSFEYSWEAEIMVAGVPEGFTLGENYPNPFGGGVSGDGTGGISGDNTGTKIPFTVNETSPVKLTVYSSAGALVATLFEGTAEGGREYTITFNPREESSGVYFYRLETDKHSRTRKMLYLK